MWMSESANLIKLSYQQQYKDPNRGRLAGGLHGAGVGAGAMLGGIAVGVPTAIGAEKLTGAWKEHLHSV